MNITLTSGEIEELKELGFKEIASRAISLGDCDDYRDIFKIEINQEEVKSIYELVKDRSNIYQDGIYSETEHMVNRKSIHDKWMISVDLPDGTVSVEKFKSLSDVNAHAMDLKSSGVDFDIWELVDSDIWELKKDN